MSVHWTISDGTRSFEFKDRHLTSLHREWGQLQTGKVMFSAERVQWDSDPMWPELTWLTICKDGIPWFRGRRMLVNAVGQASHLGLDYELVDPWWDIEDVTFHQPKLSWDQYGQPVYVDTTEYIYNQDHYGHKLHTGQMIVEALQWVLTDRQRAGIAPPFQIGVVNPAADIPWRQEQDRKCAEVIRDMAINHPNAVGWFDYTTGLPTFHYRLLSSMQAVTVYIPSNHQRHEITLKKRVDLSCEAVIVRYKTVVTSNSRPCVIYQTEIHPTDASLYGTRRCFHTVDLRPSTGTIREAEVRTATLSIFDIAWWEAHLPEYDHVKNPLIQIISISTVSWDNTAASPDTFARETSDAIPDWTGFSSAQQTFRCTARVHVWRDNTHTNVVSKADVQLAVGPITVTNAGASSSYEVYSELTGFDPAEPKPSHLSRDYYDGLNAIGWEGSIRIREREVATPPNSSPLGKGFHDYAGTLINISGGRPEWETMRAIPQRGTQHVDTGETRIQCGFPTHLSMDTLVDQQRKARHRIVSITYERVTGYKVGDRIRTGGIPVRSRGGTAHNITYYQAIETEA